MARYSLILLGPWLPGGPSALVLVPGVGEVKCSRTLSPAPRPQTGPPAAGRGAPSQPPSHYSKPCPQRAPLHGDRGLDQNPQSRGKTKASPGLPGPLSHPHEGPVRGVGAPTAPEAEGPARPPETLKSQLCFLERQVPPLALLVPAQSYSVRPCPSAWPWGQGGATRTSCVLAGAERRAPQRNKGLVVVSAHFQGVNAPTAASVQLLT